MQLTVKSGRRLVKLDKREVIFEDGTPFGVLDA